MRKGLSILIIVLLVGCGGNSNTKDEIGSETENTSNITQLEIVADVKVTTADDKIGSEKNGQDIANIDQIEKMANEFKSNYVNGTFQNPHTKETINVLRALKTNMALSVSEKFSIILNRRPSSMAQKGAELALYLSELERADITEKEQAELMKRISYIYGQYHETDLAIAYRIKTLDIYNAINNNLELAYAYEAIGSLYREGKDDDDSALKYYHLVLETEGFDDYDQKSIKHNILTILAQNARREEVRKYYDIYSEEDPDEYASIKIYLEKPGVKLKLRKNSLSISGEPGEVPGLAEIMFSKDHEAISAFMRKILETALEEEEKQ